MTFPRKRLNTTQRQALYDAERDKAIAAGLGNLPICNLCKLPVDGARDAWDESHDGTPHAFGGKVVGVAHRPCNRQHGAKVVTPMVAKSNRVRARFTGAYRPQTPMPFGRDDNLKSKIGGGYEWRDSGEPFRGFGKR